MGKLNEVKKHEISIEKITIKSIKIAFFHLIMTHFASFTEKVLIFIFLLPLNGNLWRMTSSENSKTFFPLSFTIFLILNKLQFFRTQYELLYTEIKIRTGLKKSLHSNNMQMIVAKLLCSFFVFGGKRFSVAVKQNFISFNYIFMKISKLWKISNIACTWWN